MIFTYKWVNHVYDFNYAQYSYDWIKISIHLFFKQFVTEHPLPTETYIKCLPTN